MYKTGDALHLLFLTCGGTALPNRNKLPAAVRIGQDHPSLVKPFRALRYKYTRTQRATWRSAPSLTRRNPARPVFGEAVGAQNAVRWFMGVMAAEVGQDHGCDRFGMMPPRCVWDREARAARARRGQLNGVHRFLIGRCLSACAAPPTG